MSIALMTQVWGLDLPHPEQSVLLAMADHAQDDGSDCFPSVPRVAWKTGYSERQIQRIINGLIATGILVVVTSRVGGRHNPTEFRICIEKGDKKSPFIPGVTEERVTSETGKGDIFNTKGDILSEKGDIAVSPESYNHITIIETSAPLGADAPLSATEIQDHEFAEEIYRDLLALNPKHKQPNFKKWAATIRLMRARDSRPLEEIRSMWRWANNHHFWRTNILSPDKLREKWDKLVIQKNNGGTNAANRQFDNSARGRVERAYAERERQQAKSEKIIDA